MKLKIHPVAGLLMILLIIAPDDVAAPVELEAPSGPAVSTDITGSIATATAAFTDELDAYWAELSRTVAEGDFEGYAATYHEDAVLVNLQAGTTYPISEALAGWKQGFDDTAAGRMSAGVEFRFSQRLNDETTAHETGIFRYHYQVEGQDEVVMLVHFEGLLVKKDGEWKMLMEYQKEMATRDEWNALAD